MNRYRAAIESWAVVGFVLALVLGSEAYQKSDPPPRTGNAHVTAFLGQSRQTLPAGSFRGGEVTAVMAGAELDLRATAVAPGEEMVVEVLAVLAGITIRVPAGWTVDSRTVPVAGGVRDRRLHPFDPPPPTAPRLPAPRLVLRGAVVMGGLTITS